MRHAEAQSPFDAANDFERTLTERGVSDAFKAAKYIFDQGVPINKVIFSAASRTTSTAQLLGELNNIANSNMMSEEKLYNASIGTVLDFILRLENDWDSVILVGHNPTFSYLAEYLSDYTPISLAPSNLVAIQFDVDSWTMVTQGLGSIEWMYLGATTT